MYKSTFFSFVLVTSLVSNLSTVKCNGAYGSSCKSNLDCGKTFSCISNICSCLDGVEFWNAEHNSCISSNVKSIKAVMNIDSMLGLANGTFVTYGQIRPDTAELKKRRTNNLNTFINKTIGFSHFNLIALPEEKYASTLGYEVYVWNASDLTILLKTDASFNLAPNAGQLALLANGDLACAKGRTIYILDSRDLTVKKSFSGAANEIRSLVALTDGNLATEGIEESLLVWDVVQGRVKQRVGPCTGCLPMALAYLTNGKLAMATQSNISIYVSDANGLWTFEYSITGKYRNVIALKKGYFAAKSLAPIDSNEYVYGFSSVRDDVRFQFGTSFFSRCMTALTDSDVGLGYDDNLVIWGLSQNIDQDSLLTTVKTSTSLSSSSSSTEASSILPEETTTPKNTQTVILSNRIIVFFNLILTIIFYYQLL